MNVFHRQRRIYFVIAAILAVSCSEKTGSEDFHKYRARYEATIDNARELVRRPEEPFNFRTDWFIDDLAPQRPNVCAARTKSGMLFVCIMSYNIHRGMKFGYIYTEESMVNEEIARTLDTYGCGGWKLTNKLNDNWWAAEIDPVL